MLETLGLAAYAPEIALATIILLLVAFASEKFAPEVVAIGGMAFFLFTGMASTNDMLDTLSNSAPWTIVAMFILSSALVRTGVLEGVGTVLQGFRRYGQTVVMISFILFNIVASAFFNNIPQVVMMIPVTMLLAKACEMSPSSFLMPLSFATILGGTLALIGASTNLVVDGVTRDAGLPAFTMFEITPIGIVVAIAGTLYLTFVGRHLIPERNTVSSMSPPKGSSQFLIEVLIPLGSAMIGRNPRDVSLLEGQDRRVIDVIRGDVSLRRDMANVRLEAGDIVVMKSAVANVLTMRGKKSVEFATPEVDPMAEAVESDDDVQPVGVRRDVLAEAIVGPKSRLVGRTLRNERLRRRYGVYPIAVHRHEESLESRLEDVKLRVGDTILIEGAPEDLERLAKDAHLINLNTPTEKAVRHEKALIAGLTLAAVVLVSALSIMPIAGAAWIGVAVVFLTGCIDAEEGVQSVEWSVILLLYAMLTIGAGLEHTGAVKVVVDALEPVLGQLHPVAVLAAIYLLASVMTEIVTANAVAVVVTPIAIGLAQTLGYDPRPFIVAVMFAASASFATPVGYQTNTLVYSAGGYKFADFFRVGAPLNVICGVVTVAMIYLTYSF
ncbi:SLC13 family permease [Aurantimonas sp. Leaf443]|uniref:SLC13 family permease n=1 Tax=Aurantimonas sp. Leaf443 TaxID=1736378 RepID=UPI0006FA7F14|nr:SLC13 family permease [Aurantimonas sp. Leaf443]KQT86587.1 hypothetical protein ASG48_17715 [Aurantimonas sp. Leaf443]